MSDVALRPLDAGDLDFLAEVVADESTRRFTRIPEPPPDGFPQAWLDVGLALAPSIEREAATAELGYLIAPRARGRGHATTALRLLSDWAFDEVGLLRLERRIGTENVASQTVARRAGYTLEGTLRSTHLKQGIREDTQIWSRLRSDRT